MGRRQWVVRSIVATGVLLAVVGTGYAISTSGSGANVPLRSGSSTNSSAPGVTSEADVGASNVPKGAGPAMAGTPGAGDSAAAPNQAPSADRLVVVNAEMDVRVTDVLKAVETIRAAAAASGGTVSDLTMTSGTGDTPPPPPPQPLDAGSSIRSTGPSRASVTLRVPAAKLPDVQRRVTTLGEVVSQSSSQSDVTQQHVDMAARLKNLQAEEIRLRDLLRRAGSVSSLLEVERELSRVRGEIESMQAQIAYLETQAAMATLTITLAQPGPLVRPSSATWGIADAFTSGVQSAAGVVRAFITGTIALSPIAVLALLAWAMWRLVPRRKKTAPAA